MNPRKVVNTGSGQSEPRKWRWFLRRNRRRVSFVIVFVLALCVVAVGLYRYRDTLGFLAEELLVQSYQETPPYYPRELHPRLIQHAGGGIRGLSYTNTIEALSENYLQGERFFELDFDTTSDNQVVCIHGWEQAGVFSGGVVDHRYSLGEFVGMHRQDGLTQVTLASLLTWLRANREAIIVTDVKGDNVEVLRMISTQGPEIERRFIPQIYRLGQYEQVRRLGYPEIILTLYASNYSDEGVVRFVRGHRLFAVTAPKEKLFAGRLAEKLSKLGMAVYAHTSNDFHEYRLLREKGVVGVYTDFLRTSLLDGLAGSRE